MLSDFFMCYNTTNYFQNATKQQSFGKIFPKPLIKIKKVSKRDAPFSKKITKRDTPIDRI